MHHKIVLSLNYLSGLMQQLWLVCCLQRNSWGILRKVVTWSPFIQHFKKNRYPWIQLAGHHGELMCHDVTHPQVIVDTTWRQLVAGHHGEFDVMMLHIRKSFLILLGDGWLGITVSWRHGLWYC